MRDTLIGLVPWIFAVGVPLFAVQFLRKMSGQSREEARRGRVFVAGRARVTAVERRTTHADFGDVGSPYVDRFAVRCVVEAPGGPVEAWSDTLLDRARVRVGEQVPVWFDPGNPSLFVLKAPRRGIGSAVPLVVGVIFVVVYLVGLVVLLRVNDVL